MTYCIIPDEKALLQGIIDFIKKGKHPESSQVFSLVKKILDKSTCSILMFLPVIATDASKRKETGVP